MPVTPPELLSLARNLSSGNPEEVRARASVGRAYYAALHGCEWIVKRIPVPKRPDERLSRHATVIRAMKSCAPIDVGGNATLAESIRIAGRHFESAHRARTFADYDIAVIHPASTPHEQIMRVEKLLKAMLGIRQSLDKVSAASGPPAG